MVLSDIVELCKAGFSKEEILRMVNAPAPAQAPAKAPAPAPAPTPVVDNLVKTVNNLISTLQANAILNSRQQPPETPEDIFANLIAPPAKNEGGIK